MSTKKQNRIVNSAVGVRKEVATAFSKFCRERGLRISFAAEQALAAWMREMSREGEPKSQK